MNKEFKYYAVAIESIDLSKINTLLNKEARFLYRNDFSTLVASLSEEEVIIIRLKFDSRVWEITHHSTDPDSIFYNPVFRNVFDFRLYDSPVIRELIKLYPTEVKAIPTNKDEIDRARLEEHIAWRRHLLKFKILSDNAKGIIWTRKMINVEEVKIWNLTIDDLPLDPM